MGLYKKHLQAPLKTLESTWTPEDGELFRDSSFNLYMGDNVTPSDQLTPINGVAGAQTTFPGLPWSFSGDTGTVGIAAGQFRFNQLFASTTTEVRVVTTDGDAVDQSAVLGVMTSGILTIHKEGGGSVVFSVTRMVPDSGFTRFTVVHLSGVKPTEGEACYLDLNPDAPGVRVIEGIITQDGTANAPTVTILKNSMVSDISAITYQGVGNYRLVMVGAFTEAPEERYAPVVVTSDDNGALVIMRLALGASGDPDHLDILVRDALSDTFTELATTVAFTAHTY